MLLPKNREPTTPGEILREEYLSPLKMTQADLAERLGVTTETINRIVNSNRNVTVQMALRLGKGLGTTPQFWLNLQAACDLWRESREMKNELRGIKTLKTG